MTLKILLVDDNPTFTAAVRLLLDQLPGVAIVGQASSGTEALGLAEAARPDLLLLDIAMPGMSGLAVAQHLQHASHRPAIVFLSACEAAAYGEAACQLGALACVDKADLVMALPPIIDRLAASFPRLQAVATAPG